MFPVAEPPQIHESDDGPTAMLRIVDLDGLPHVPRDHSAWHLLVPSLIARLHLNNLVNPESCLLLRAILLTPLLEHNGRFGVQGYQGLRYHGRTKYISVSLCCCSRTEQILYNRAPPSGGRSHASKEVYFQDWKMTTLAAQGPSQLPRALPCPESCESKDLHKHRCRVSHVLPNIIGAGRTGLCAVAPLEIFSLRGPILLRAGLAFAEPRKASLAASGL